jgi:hypothetical protein
MKRNDYIALIIEHCVNQGYKDSDGFVNYITNELVNMNTEELANELDALENQVV